jgi:hypothetical protein
MATAASQINEVYAEVITDAGHPTDAREQEAFAEVITDNGGATALKLLYLEVITDPPT